MAAPLAVVGGLGALAVGGAAVSSASGETPGTVVAIIGAVAVVLVAVIGVIGNYYLNRRTAPSPPGPDAHDIAIHDRVTVMETNVSDLRHRMNSIDARVSPLAATVDARFDETLRRLDRIEERLDGKGRK